MSNISAAHTGGARQDRRAWPSHRRERDEKRQRTEATDQSPGDPLESEDRAEAGIADVHRRAAGDDAAGATHPGPDHRPRPPAASGVPVRGCAGAALRRPGTERPGTERLTAPTSALLPPSVPSGNSTGALSTFVLGAVHSRPVYRPAFCPRS